MAAIRFSEGWGKAGSRPRYRARFLPRRIIVTLPVPSNELRAARDAGDLPVSTARCVKVKGTHRNMYSPQSPARNRRPARDVLGLLCAAPGGVTLLTTASDAQRQPTTRMSPRLKSPAPVAKSHLRREHAAWAAVTSLRTRYSHRSRSAFQDASRNAPREPRRAQHNPARTAGDKLSAKKFALKRLGI